MLILQLVVKMFWVPGDGLTIQISTSMKNMLHLFITTTLLLLLIMIIHPILLISHPSRTMQISTIVINISHPKINTSQIKNNNNKSIRPIIQQLQKEVGEMMTIFQHYQIKKTMIITISNTNKYFLKTTHIKRIFSLSTKKMKCSLHIQKNNPRVMIKQR